MWCPYPETETPIDEFNGTELHHLNPQPRVDPVTEPLENEDPPPQYPVVTGGNTPAARGSVLPEEREDVPEEPPPPYASLGFDSHEPNVPIIQTMTQLAESQTNAW